VLKDGNLAPALLFKDLATLRSDAPLFRKVDELRWRGPAASFREWTEKIGDARLAARVEKLSGLPSSRPQSLGLRASRPR
jgi:hypothetical protein